MQVNKCMNMKFLRLQIFALSKGKNTLSKTTRTKKSLDNCSRDEVGKVLNSKFENPKRKKNRLWERWPNLSQSGELVVWVAGLFALVLKGQGHQGIFSLVKSTLRGNRKFLLSTGAFHGHQGNEQGALSTGAFHGLQGTEQGAWSAVFVKY